MNLICLDVGGTKIESAIYNGGEFEEMKTEKTSNDVISQIKEIINNLRRKNTKAICIAWAGWVSLDGMILCSPHLNVNKFNLQKYISVTVGLPVFIDNDANVFTAFHAKKRHSKETILGITIGTGIGSGISRNGIIFRGQDNFAGEIGHQTLGLRTAEQWFSGVAGDSNTNAKKRLPLMSEWLCNQTLTLNPSVIIIGGGIGRNIWAKHQTVLQHNINQRLKNFPIKTQLIFSNNKNEVLLGTPLLVSL